MNKARGPCNECGHEGRKEGKQKESMGVVQEVTGRKGKRNQNLPLEKQVLQSVPGAKI